MNIYIPSSNRAHRLEVLRQIPVELVILVVPMDQLGDYATKWSRVAAILCPPEEIKGIAATRDWLLRRGGRMLMLDDDLAFFTRERLGVMAENRSLRRSTLDDILEMLGAIDTALDSVAHASISARQFNNQRPDEPAVYGRYFRVMAYNTTLMPMLVQSSVPMIEDIEMSVQLYKMGCESRIFSRWCHDDTKGTNSEGGCSTYRTQEVQAAAAHKMAEIHAPFVTVIEKNVKSGKDFGHRVDVKIDWKGLYEYGQKNKVKKS